MVEQGLAWHHKKHTDDERLADLEREARSKRLNIWSDKEPIAPWEWPGKRLRSGSER